MWIYMTERKSRDKELRETFGALRSIHEANPFRMRHATRQPIANPCPPLPASTLDADGSGELSKDEFFSAVRTLVDERFDDPKLETLWREVRRDEDASAAFLALATCRFSFSIPPTPGHAAGPRAPGPGDGPT